MRTAAKRDQIVDVSIRHFAEHGYQGAKVEDIAKELGIAKGSVFQHFGSKAGLFLEAYKKAIGSLPAWLDAPKTVRNKGFFATLDYWLQRTEHLVAEDYVPYRVSLIGNYGTDLVLKRDINRFLVSEDPYGTLEFVEFGVRRGEIRDDVDAEMIASMLDWLAERFQEALASEELDPGLIHRQPERRGMRIKEFLAVPRDGIVARPEDP
jgi:AcrR family transcriptional regulator